MASAESGERSMHMTEARRNPLKFWPEAFVIVWLAFLAFAVWQKASQADVPPCYDAFTYYVKAQAVWEVLSHHGGLKELLNAAPTVRPPATVLVSYPFGFTTDFHGFLFRTVIIPILLLTAAVYVATWHRGNTQPLRVLTAALAITLTTFGGFWYFRVAGNWGPSRWRRAFVPHPPAPYSGRYWRPCWRFSVR
jgi:hypothetical protein